ncbi:hypothetical protein OG730_08045 [Streptomyces sp. NBC_01298]|uniref:helix-turn-helix domain-containing protein n=1 Tax=Streptomyces sp. NBC_01298 TaxID=2903817 RepID=UPI002E0E9F30|nr:hypothetical protein OG730_08045 [Streptomyces sp. NBC_01298]
MAEPRKQGRRWAEIQQGNDQARRLAIFLRAQVDASGKTLAVLAPEVGYSKSMVGTHLSGRIPPERFVTALIRATVPPHLRERREAEALKLLSDTRHPPRTSTPRVPSQAPGAGIAAMQTRQIETYERLTRALEQQAELRQTVENSARLIWVLLSMIQKLNERVGVLCEDRDQLAQSAGREALEAAEHKLNRARAQQAKALSQAARAEEKKRQAEHLAARLQAQIEELTDELGRLSGDDPSAHDKFPRPTVPVQASRTDSRDAEADDFDAALARAEAINDTDTDTIDRISTEVIGGPAASIPDNSVTRMDAPDTAIAPAARDTTDWTGDLSLDVLRAQLEEARQESFLYLEEALNTREEADRARAEAALLRSQLYQAGRHEDAVVTEDPEREPSSYEELWQRLDAFSGLMVTADPAVAAGLGQHPRARVWAAKTWHALQALDSYAHEAKKGFKGTFYDYCKAGPAGASGWPVKQVAVSRDMKTPHIFPVPTSVAPSGVAVMKAGLVIDRATAVSPRLYFLDDAKGATGKIIIGYIGPHLSAAMR